MTAPDIHGQPRVRDRYIASPARMAQDLANARLLVGHHLASVEHYQYYFNNEISLGDIGPLIWRVNNDQTLAMYLMSDGESVGADLASLEPSPPFEIDTENTCAWRREDLLTRLCIPELEGKLITDVQGMFDQMMDQKPRLVAFKITFETGDYLIYLNQGDDGVVLINELPEQVSGISTSLETSLK